MKISNVNINLEDLSSQELFRIEREIRGIRKRRGEAELLRLRMTALLEEANAAGFDFICNDSGSIHPVDIELYDNQ